MKRWVILKYGMIILTLHLQTIVAYHLMLISSMIRLYSTLILSMRLYKEFKWMYKVSSKLLNSTFWEEADQAKSSWVMLNHVQNVFKNSIGLQAGDIPLADVLRFFQGDERTMQF